MPMYDYRCEACGKRSLLCRTLAEHDGGKVTCPACGSAKMRQLVSSF